MTDLCRCPICGGSPSTIQYIKSVEDRGWSVGCLRCKIFASDEDKDKAIRFWNEVNSREVKPTGLKPCPFCGSENVVLSQDEYGSWAVECHGYACHAYVANAKWRCERKEDAMALWNRRVSE